MNLPENEFVLFGTEQYFKSLILTLDGRVDNVYVEMIETSPCNAVTDKCMLVILEIEMFQMTAFWFN